ncbi:hypothetical protein OJAV_G00233220 [Oryzias javanicus]|uniref:Hcy-binding domain-containing protein n=1 Tax=Oryzias javanicus TaxID=123683 RepID=A0A3S2NPI7_ORYJA|nr:hypothetical protein OJAV_G00233220 [Oryzias javanicus]
MRYSDVITTATYQASVQGFVTHLGMSAERARELLMSGVHLAREVKQGAALTVSIAPNGFIHPDEVVPLETNKTLKEGSASTPHGGRTGL